VPATTKKRKQTGYLSVGTFIYCQGLLGRRFQLHENFNVLLNFKDTNGCTTYLNSKSTFSDLLSLRGRFESQVGKSMTLAQNVYSIQPKGEPRRKASVCPLRLFPQIENGSELHHDTTSLLNIVRHHFLFTILVPNCSEIVLKVYLADEFYR